MKIISDSGSTKTAWAILSCDGSSELRRGEGINPFFSAGTEIETNLKSVFNDLKEPPDEVWFYGAGCLPEKCEALRKLLADFFGTERVEVNSDLLGAARALFAHEAGIACILGTGSNSCLYDGRRIVDNVPPLGFILGDEGSGAHIGRTLLSDVFKRRLPAEVCRLFLSETQLTQADAIENVYRRPLPSRYLAQFTKFVAAHIDIPEINKLVKDCFELFLIRNVLIYKDVDKLPIRFTGSIAYHFSKQLFELAKLHNLNLSQIVKEPINNLIQFHINPITPQ